MWNVMLKFFHKKMYGNFKTEKRYNVFVYFFMSVISLVMTIINLVLHRYTLTIILLYLHLIIVWHFIDELLIFCVLKKRKKELKLLDRYYFCNEEIINLRKKYFNIFNTLIDIRSCLLGNGNLTDDDKLKKINIITNKLYYYINSNKTAKSEFEKSYSIKVQPILCDIIFESLMIDYVFKMKLYSVDIFSSKESVLRLEKGYPISYEFFKICKNKNVLDFIKFVKRIINYDKNYVKILKNNYFLEFSI